MRTLSEYEQQPKSTNRLRQRLVGGLVVLALAVLLLPLWLDGGGLKTPTVQPVPKAPTITQPAEITIPAPLPAQQQLLENPPASPVPATEPKPSDAKTTIDAPAVSVPAPKPLTTQPASSAPVSKPSPDAVVEHKEPAKPAVETPPPVVAQPKPTAPSPEKAPVPAPASVASNQLWVVQLGSFSDELNAKGLARSVSDAGFKVEITPLFAKKGTVWRVRVGPYASRELAVKATTQLRERLGRDGLVMPK